MQPATKQCLARSLAAAAGTVGPAAVSVVACDPSSAEQAWNFGAVNETIAQVRSAADAGLCLTFNSSSLHMEACHKEMGDKTTPNQSGCTDGNCRFSGIIYQLWCVKLCLAFALSSLSLTPKPIRFLGRVDLLTGVDYLFGLMCG
jgi:hypothetical protein